MIFGLSEVSHKLKIEKDVVKTMSKIFADYLTPSACPPSGVVRQFSLDDLRVLSYVTNYWEDEPDIEHIKIGLNNRSHFEYPYSELIISLAPIFSDPPDDIEEPFPSYVLFNEVQDGLELFHLASAYKKGGDMLTDTAIDTHIGYEIIYPIIYSYRHAVELYLKSYVGSMDNTHSLMKLYRKFSELMQEKFKANPAEWFVSIIKTLDEFDPDGTSFRYGSLEPRYEVFVDLSILRAKMNLFANAFREIES
jgi:hypothetical protein